MFNGTDDELQRTNNSVEGWHRSFQSHVSACHNVFWKCLSVLQKEENMVRISIVHHHHQGNVMEEWKILSLYGKIEFRKNHYSGMFFPVIGPFSQILQTGKFHDSNRRILRILDDYLSRQRLQYFWAIAHNLTFQELRALIILETC